MAQLSGTFTAPGVSAGVAATKNLSIQLTGLVDNCAVIFEQSTDGGTTWRTFYTLDQVLPPFRPKMPAAAGYVAGGAADSAAPESYTWTVVAGLYRINCTAFDSGWFAWSIATW
jgi:hypothetical protein